MGAGTALSYRSSVQYWLDKQADPGLTSALPMPIPTLATTTTLDEITGNSLTQLYSFHRGVYDGTEREFRGFRLVTSLDTLDFQGVQQDGGDAGVPLAPPLLTRTWYHTGREGDATGLAGSPYQDDSALVISPTRLTRTTRRPMTTSTSKRSTPPRATGCFARSRACHCARKRTGWIAAAVRTSPIRCQPGATRRGSCSPRPIPRVRSCCPARSNRPATPTNVSRPTRWSASRSS
ncbi:MAG: Putative toxin subunit [uncultured Paraburkholderia sp.]|nr:MAG: Putative toxin subunit [uncultured Paraburkholderia sp.]